MDHPVNFTLIRHVLTVLAWFLAFGLMLLAGGCSIAIDRSISRYNAVSSQINLGDKKEKILPILEQAQAGLPSKARKAPEQFLKNGKHVYIYYARIRIQPDGLVTDDEFTPYVFIDGKLQAIGWQTLGGPSTQGQARDNITVIVK